MKKSLIIETLNVLRWAVLGLAVGFYAFGLVSGKGLSPYISIWIYLSLAKALVEYWGVVRRDIFIVRRGRVFRYMFIENHRDYYWEGKSGIASLSPKEFNDYEKARKDAVKWFKKCLK